MTEHVDAAQEEAPAPGRHRSDIGAPRGSAGGKLDPATAEQARRDPFAFSITRHEARPLAERIWHCAISTPAMTPATWRRPRRGPYRRRDRRRHRPQPHRRLGRRVADVLRRRDDTIRSAAQCNFPCRCCPQRRSGGDRGRPAGRRPSRRNGPAQRHPRSPSALARYISGQTGADVIGSRDSETTQHSYHRLKGRSSHRR